MQLSHDFTEHFTVRAQPTTPESRKATADGIEAFVGAILTGKSKPGEMDAGLLADAVQGLRDAAAIIAGLDEQAARMAFLAEHWHSSLDGVRTRDYLADTGNLMRHAGIIGAIDYLRSQSGKGAAS